MTFGSLFAGIGGFDLGLERAGMTCRWQVEIDPFCRAVLAKHWPEVPRYDDVRTVGVDTLERVDVLCGGFPCQDISDAGRRVGIGGARSGLWSEYARLIGELRPRYVLVENVTALLVRGFGRVLADLAARRYDAEWDCLPASAFGAPHRRDRIWILAYPAEFGWHELASEARRATGPTPSGYVRTKPDLLAYAPKLHSDGGGLYREHATREVPESRDGRGSPGDVGPGATQWGVEPDLGRVAYGVPARVDRLRGLGNAVVPQIAEWLGRRILAAECDVNGGRAV